MLSWYFKSNLLSRILIGLIAGAVVGKLDRNVVLRAVFDIVGGV